MWKNVSLHAGRRRCDLLPAQTAIWLMGLWGRCMSTCISHPKRSSPQHFCSLEMQTANHFPHLRKPADCTWLLKFPAIITFSSPFYATKTTGRRLKSDMKTDTVSLTSLLLSTHNKTESTGLVTGVTHDQYPPTLLHRMHGLWAEFNYAGVGGGG